MVSPMEALVVKSVVSVPLVHLVQQQLFKQIRSTHDYQHDTFSATYTSVC